MPFIKQKRREMIEKLGLNGLDEVEVGDRCYVFYKEMVDRWKAEPKWRTAHAIQKEFETHVVDGYDNVTARLLAWQVFFQLHVMPHEIKKQAENGDI